MPPDTTPTAVSNAPSAAPSGDPDQLGPSTDLLIRVRRGADIAQPVFRALVDAVSNPGRPVDLPAGPEGLHPVVLPVLTVVDLQTVLSVVDTDSQRARSLASAIGRVTGAPVGDDHRSADVVLVTDPAAFTPDLVWTLLTGTAMSPEQGAKVFVACSAIVEADAAVDDVASDGSAVVVTGPVASDGRRITITGVDPRTLAVVDRVNGAYPAGIDVFVVDPTGRVIGLPRSNRLSAGTKTPGDDS